MASFRRLLLILMLLIPLGSAASGIENAKIRQVRFDGPSHPEDQYLLEVKLGKISPQGFSGLHTRFGTSAVQPHDPHREYSLVDFLPPFIQAINGKRYADHARNTPKSIAEIFAAQGVNLEPMIYSNANCHSVTWQWINHKQGRGQADAYFLLVDGDRLYNQLPGEAMGELDNIKAGDVLFVRGTSLKQPNSILHSAVYLGDGLVFEKADYGAKHPYRIAYLKDVVGKYKRILGSPSIFTFRPTRHQSPLPLIMDEYPLGNPENISAHGLDSKLIADKLAQDHSLSEEWDRDENRARFILARIASTKTVNKEDLTEVRPSLNSCSSYLLLDPVALKPTNH